MSENTEILKNIGKKISSLEKEKNLCEKRRDAILKELETQNLPTRHFNQNSQKASDIDERLKSIQFELDNYREKWNKLYKEDLDSINSSFEILQKRMTKNSDQDKKNGRQ